MAIEIVDFPMKNGDVPISYVKLPEGKPNLGWLATLNFWSLDGPQCLLLKHAKTC